MLHVATHAFFLPVKTREAAAAHTRGINLGVGNDAPGPGLVENPLLRSGLALEGANQRRGACGEDGILTALEAASLDLHGTELVVLSACETGVGEVSNGEGVYGLRRALVLAGSDSQVMSLWKVSDEATKELMVAYYKRLAADEGRAEALRQVQLGMLRSSKERQVEGLRELGVTTGRGVADYSHPFFWAAFIQSGDWTRIRQTLVAPISPVAAAACCLPYGSALPVERPPEGTYYFVDRGTTVYSGREVTKRAVITERPLPDYTEEARNNGTKGTLRVRAVLCPDGTIGWVTALTELPDGLTQRAMEATRGIKFKPAEKDGRKVAQWIILEYNFQIVDKP
jgi:TonB family protein